MKYAILIYDSAESLARMGDAMDDDYEKFAGGLVEHGYMRGGEQLASSSVATTLRGEGGKVIAHDGPFAETKEQLGGFFLIECASLDEALEAAGQVPSLRSGGVVEVRPVVEGPDEEHH